MPIKTSKKISKKKAAIKSQNSISNTIREKKVLPKKQFKFRSIFFSDVVWISVSISVLLSSVLFYFQVLQPKILNQISILNQNKIAEIQTNYSKQVSSFIEVQNTILTPTLSKSNSICTTVDKNETINNSKIKINELNKKLVPTENLSKPPSYNYFSDYKINQVYNQQSSTYVQSVSNLRGGSKKLLEYLEYKTTKNQWVENCNELQKIVSLNKTIINICKNSKPVNTNEAISKLEVKEQDLCKKWVIDKSLTDEKFKLLWLDIFAELNQLEISLIDDLDTTNIQKESIEFEKNTQNRINEIKKYVRSKSEIQNIWYLLDIDI